MMFVLNGKGKSKNMFKGSDTMEMWGCKYGREHWQLKGCSPNNPKPVQLALLDRIRSIPMIDFKEIVGTCKNCYFGVKIK